MTEHEAIHLDNEENSLRVLIPGGELSDVLFWYIEGRALVCGFIRVSPPDCEICRARVCVRLIDEETRNRHESLSHDRKLLAIDKGDACAEDIELALLATLRAIRQDKEVRFHSNVNSRVMNSTTFARSNFFIAGEMLVMY